MTATGEVDAWRTGKVVTVPRRVEGLIVENLHAHAVVGTISGDDKVVAVAPCDIPLHDRVVAAKHANAAREFKPSRDIRMTGRNVTFHDIGERSVDAVRGGRQTINKNSTPPVILDAIALDQVQV